MLQKNINLYIGDDCLRMKYKYKKELTKIKRIVQNPKNLKYLKQSDRIEDSGILLVIHESQELGASILALHIAKTLVEKGINVYIVSRQFGVMNDKYNKIAPVQIALNTKAYKKICKNLSKTGFRKALMITATTGDLVKVTKECGFEVVSMIHELNQVIKMLHLEVAVKEMLKYSDKILFSTSIAKKQILELVNISDSEKVLIKPQGTYFCKPSEKIIKKQSLLLIDDYPILKNKKIIIGIGNTSERKGFDIFLNTASIMPEYEFVWAGKKEKYYDEAIGKCGKPDNFIYVGSMDNKQLSALYTIADVYLMCSRFDTLPSTMFEALLFETPIIGAKNSGGIVDVVNNTNGILTENVDSYQFSEAIEQVLVNNYRIKDMDNSFEKYVTYIVSLYERKIDD